MTPTAPLNGAESLVHTLAASGVELCFANPGTSEMHFVAALDRIPGVRCVLGLFEGVVTGAADGYYRMAGTPAATLLHLGPASATAWPTCTTPARRARASSTSSATMPPSMCGIESPLKSEAEAIAGSVSHWVRSCQPRTMWAPTPPPRCSAARDGAEGRIATLHPAGRHRLGRRRPARGGAPQPRPPTCHVMRCRPSRASCASVAPRPCCCWAPVAAAACAAQQHAAAIAAHTGCRLLAEFYNARMPGGRGTAAHPAPARTRWTPPWRSWPAPTPWCWPAAAEPIGFFAYPGKPSQHEAGGHRMLLTLAAPQHDVPAALQALADELGVTRQWLADTPAAGRWPSRCADGRERGRRGRRTLPEQAVVVDEAVSNGRGFGAVMVDAAPHDWLQTMGGAIGFGLPGGVGAALGAPGRPVLVLEGDGSAMYTRAGAVDHGPREAARGGAGVRQPRLPHPAG
jgi:acetolactate synthase-1/2/3 large subunit